MNMTIKYLALVVLLVVAAAEGDLGEEECKDNNGQGYCEKYLEYEPLVCERQVALMAPTCAKTCGLCRPSLVINQCDDWWGNGLCTHLLKHRPEYCGMIVDNLTENRVQFMNSAGGQVITNMTMTYCARTCVQCTGPFRVADGCEDLANTEDCEWLANKKENKKANYCESDVDYMKYACKKTCDLCEEEPFKWGPK